MWWWLFLTIEVTHTSISMFFVTNMFLRLPLGKNKAFRIIGCHSKKAKTLKRWLIIIVCIYPEKKAIPLISISWFFPEKALDISFAIHFVIWPTLHVLFKVLPVLYQYFIQKKVQWQIIFTCPSIPGATGRSIFHFLF